MKEKLLEVPGLIRPFDTKRFPVSNKTRFLPKYEWCVEYADLSEPMDPDLTENR